MSDIFKDIGNLWTRLFDHRSFLHGEKQFFLREFEEKRTDTEVKQLFNILETITDIKDTEIDRMKLIANNHLPSVEINLLLAFDLVDGILQNESNDAQKEKLIQNRTLRDVSLKEFLKDIDFKKERVDRTFEEKEVEILELYLNLERKLRLSN